VWVEDREAVRNRTIDILGNRYRGAHASVAEDVCLRFAEQLVIDAPNSALINFRNGMLDWKTQALLEHDESYASCVQIPHDFDPDATCPRFDAFLDSVMSPDYQQIVWEAIGYLLFSGNPLQIAFLLHGTGGNGKGTLIKVLTAMLGTTNLAHQSLDSLNGDKFAAASLFGKIANIAGDIDATFQESTARFKMLTGEDRFSGEYKYGDSFGFDNFAVPLFSANKIPGSADVSKGYLRRWVNIEFDRIFTGEPIPGLGESLAATEIPGVIAKGLKHLAGLLAQGHFTVQGEAEKGRDNFALAIDQVRQWTEEETMPVDSGPVKQDDLYRDYRFWAERNGTGKLKAADFYTRLEGAGYRRAKIRGVRVFHGITMLQTHGADYNTPPKVDLDAWVAEAKDV
jgi:P4 family phage/plasmid primase-like protien